MTGWSRRRVLHAAAVTGVGLLPWVGVYAQESRTALLRASKQALVLGNSRYKHAPLRNPSNDANGMAEALKSVGFGVTLALELNQGDMRDAIQAYTAALARTKAVGLFYFAGHGAQLAWRNYLIPVDAEIGDVQELRELGIDVNSLIEGIRKAGNPMNLIILDACRDNPFGSARRIEQKGLSQLDAPPGTLLAYATAPGNTAIDGEGEHGLYTEHLLRHIRVPEAKVEDVFKRVRLAVRLQSKGLQIPWESTSLEEDFWFVPPRELSRLAAEEGERERRQELALREKRRAEEEAERRRREEEAQREAARRAAEEAERKRQQELALLEKQRIAEEAERKRKQALALEEARRFAEEAERKRREEQALREARLAEEEAKRKYQEELALRERRHIEEEAERKRKEEEARREAQRAEEEAERRRGEERTAGGKPAADLAVRLFEEELAIWEGIRESTAPGPLENYLMRYPSGRFSELAQLRLDQVLAQQGEKKIQIVSAPENPYTKGTAAANTAYKVGDRYHYRRLDLLTRIEGNPMRRRVTAVTYTEVLFNDGRFVTDLLGNPLRFPNGMVWSPNQTVPVEFAVGKRWSTRFRIVTQKGVDAELNLDFRIEDRESITVPAGTFNAFRIEARGWRTGVDGVSINLHWKRWYAPDQVRLPIATETLNRHGRGRIVASDRTELLEYRQS